MLDIHSLLLDCNLLLLQKIGNKWNSRCPICNDSKKSKKKTRFWILPSKTNIGLFNCFCHNCGYSESLRYFLKTNFPDVHKQYFKKQFKSRSVYKRLQIQNEKIKENKTKPIKLPQISLPKLIDLPEDHFANKYVDGRRIPEMWKKYLMFSENFKVWINTQIPDKFKNTSDSDSRLIIPFYTLERKMFAVGARALKNNLPRYLTIKFDENYPKIFGLERADFSKHVYVFEGQLDSLFIPNAIAMGGSISSIKKLLKYAPKDRFVLVPDLEPRNKEVCKFIEQSINIGFKVCLLPLELKQYGKDINDIVMNSNMTIKEIYNIINKNVTTGIKSKIKFKLWKKVLKGDNF